MKNGSIIAVPAKYRPASKKSYEPITGSTDACKAILRCFGFLKSIFKFSTNYV